jgi:hypothetical protein
MVSSKRNPAPLAAGRASEAFCSAAERSEDTKALFRLQVAAVSRRFGLAPICAELIASLVREAPR